MTGIYIYNITNIIAIAYAVARIHVGRPSLLLIARTSWRGYTAATTVCSGRCSNCNMTVLQGGYCR